MKKYPKADARSERQNWFPTQAVYLEAMVGDASGAHHRIFALSLKEVTRMKRSARTG